MKTYTWKEAFEDAFAGSTLGTAPPIYQNFVGYCYSIGRCVKQDHKKAAQMRAIYRLKRIWPCAISTGVAQKETSMRGFVGSAKLPRGAMNWHNTFSEELTLTGRV